MAVIHPVPKIKTPVGPSDYRPISVVPILSRVVERLVVSTYLYPALMKPPMVAEISDQFAFRPTGSTTAALIDLLHQLTLMLEKNDYVLLVSTDFTKEFDSVCHSTVMQKMAVIDLPDNIYNWIANYFEQRGLITKIHYIISAIAFNNASIIQGSVIGPPSYVVAASDLHAKRPPNSMMKYADDSYLLVDSRKISTVNEEFFHIKAWAASSNLQLDPLKTRELIVYRRGLGASVDPAPIIQGAIRVTSMRVLGVTISSNLTMGCHLDEILSSSVSSIHALRMLRSHRLGSPQLFEVARSTTLASMLYAFPCLVGLHNSPRQRSAGKADGPAAEGGFSWLKLSHLVTWLQRLTGSYLEL